MNRDFRGIWIPKEIWLSKDLSTNEKILLAEIDSLGGSSDGCFASNQYFADFFDLSKDRISRLVSGLKNKGYITVELIYKEGTCEVDKRIIKLNPYSYFYQGVQNHQGGIGENTKDITNNYNINNNNKTSKKKTTKEVRHKYGEFKNVLLSDKDLEKLKAEYGEELVEKYIKKMDEWIELNGRRYKNYYLALRQWMNKEVSKKQEKVKKQEGDTKYDEEYFTKLMEETLRGGNKF
mgnify:FL=1